MTSRTTSRFWDAYAELPERVKRRVRKAYELFEDNPRHPSLRFKKVHANRSIYSVHITRDYRAVGVQKGESIIWFWIGSHEDYDRLLDRLSSRSITHPLHLNPGCCHFRAIQI